MKLIVNVSLDIHLLRRTFIDRPHQSSKSFRNRFKHCANQQIQIFSLPIFEINYKNGIHLLTGGYRSRLAIVSSTAKNCRQHDDQNNNHCYSYCKSHNLCFRIRTIYTKQRLRQLPNRKRINYTYRLSPLWRSMSGSYTNKILVT
jgi:hypothetical protein